MISWTFVPDTLNYMIAGYLVISLLISGYILSLILRWKQAVKHYRHFQEEDREE
jgi:CcmD family protein